MPSPDNKATQLWLCLHFPQLPLEVFTRGSADSGHRPVIVVEEHRVAFCNPSAQQQELVPGMSSATACALAGTSLHALERDTAREQTALQQLAQWAYRFGPAITMRPPADLLLEVGASLKLFQGLQNIQQHIEADLNAQGFSYCSGLAHTPKAAWLLARAGSEPAWLDTPRQTLDMHHLDQVLAALPLHLLDLPEKTLQRLHKPGFSRLGDILALPRAALGKRFGRAFLLYLEQLLGTVPDPQAPLEPETSFTRQLDFLEPIHRSETLLFPMQRLLHELSCFLQSRQLDCPGFNWQLLPQDEAPITLPIRLSRPRHDKTTFLALTRTRLESLALKAPVGGLMLESGQFVNSGQASESLFEEWRGKQQQSMEELLDKLHARLKPGQIYGLTGCEEHVPELAWRRRDCNEDTPLAPRPLSNRPGWLLQRPIAITQRNNGLYWRGPLQLMLGPERIESHWWDTPVKRDYYIVRHQDGGFYWAYHDHLQQAWYLHGVFA